MNLKKNAAEQQKVDEQKKKRHGRLNYNWVGKENRRVRKRTHES